MVERVCAVLRRPGAREPLGQAQLVCALLKAMGAANGTMPSLVDVAVQLGVAHQSVYRTLATLEAKGAVVRQPPPSGRRAKQRRLEIRL